MTSRTFRASQALGVLAAAACTLAFTQATAASLEFRTAVPALTVMAPVVAAPALALSTTALSFPDTPVDSESAAFTLLVTNPGTEAVSLTGMPVVSGPFRASTSCGASLAPGAECSVAVTFKPLTTGVAQGSVTVNSNLGTRTAALTGTGVQAKVSASPAALAFGAVALGSTSAELELQVSNTGTAALTLGAPAVPAAFSLVSNNCPAALPAASTCTLGLTFTPAVMGDYSSTLTLPTNLGPQNIPLSGQGTAAVLSLSRTSVTLQSPKPGNAAPSSTVTVSNAGNINLLISAKTLSGAAAASYSVSGCDSPVAPDTSCVLTLGYTAPSQASTSATLTLSHNAAGGSSAIELGGSTAEQTDPFVSGVTVLMHFDGANGSTAMTPAIGSTPTNASVSLSTAQSKFGGSSAYFNGTSSALTFAAGTSTNFGTADFTVEGWFNATTASGVLFGYGNYAGEFHRLVGFESSTGVGRYTMAACPAGGTACGYPVVGQTPYLSAAVSLNQWHHFALVRASGVRKTYLDGVLVSSVADTSTWNTGSGMRLGAGDDWQASFTSMYFFKGYLDEVRITKGVARYTAAFVPPSEPFPQN